jgi:hypothetical protein
VIRNARNSPRNSGRMPSLPLPAARVTPGIVMQSKPVSAAVAAAPLPQEFSEEIYGPALTWENFFFSLLFYKCRASIDSHSSFRITESPPSSPPASRVNVVPVVSVVPDILSFDFTVNSQDTKEVIKPIVQSSNSKKNVVPTDPSSLNVDDIDRICKELESLVSYDV